MRPRPLEPGDVQRVREVLLANLRAAQFDEDHEGPAAELFVLMEEGLDVPAALARISLGDPEKPVQVEAINLCLYALADEVPRDLRQRFVDVLEPTWRGPLDAGEVEPGIAEVLENILGISRAAIPFLEPDADPNDISQLRSVPHELTTWLVEQVLHDIGALGQADMFTVVPEPEDVGRALATGLEERALEPPFREHALAVTILSGLRAGVTQPELDAALERLAAAESNVAAWFLQELSRWPAAGFVARRSALLLDEITDRGADPVPPPVGELMEVVATPSTDEGERVFTIQRRMPRTVDHPDVETITVKLVVLVDDELGVAGVWVLVVPEDPRAAAAAAELDPGADVLLAATEDAGAVTVDLDLARSVIADAFLRHEALGDPPPAELLLARHLLGQAPIDPAPHHPDLTDLGLTAGRADSSTAAETADLVDDPVYRNHQHLSPAVHDVVAEHRHAAGLSAEDQLPIGRALVDAYLDIIERERATIAQRLAGTLEIALHGGRADERSHRLGARLWHALTTPSVPVTEIPFFVEGAPIALELADDDVRAGFPTRRAAKRSAYQEVMRLMELGRR